jgi:PAS domain S-box-containing protein
VQSLRQHADDTAELAESILTGMVGGLETDNGDPARIARLQAILNARKPGLGRIRALFVYDENGRWLVTTEAVNLASYNNSDRDYFRHHRDTDDRAMFIGRPVQSKSSGQWVITLSRRWNHLDGSFAGVVAATVESAYFSKFYTEFDIGQRGAISLQSAEGITLAHSQDDGTAIGRDRPGQFFQTLPVNAISGALHFRSPQDGLLRLGFFQRSDRYALVVLGSKSQDDVLARWNSDARARLALVICLVVLIAAIGAFMVRQLLRGQRLAMALAENENSFRMLAEGSSDMVMRIGKDERIEYVSPSSVRILGWQPHQLVGQGALAAVNPLDVPHVQEFFASLKRGEAEEARVTFRTRCRNGS